MDLESSTFLLSFNFYSKLILDMAVQSDNTIVNILRSEVTFWLTIIGIVVSTVISFSGLTARVLANEKQVKTNQELLVEIDKKIDNILILQAEMQKDINYIIKENK